MGRAPDKFICDRKHIADAANVRRALVCRFNMLYQIPMSLHISYLVNKSPIICRNSLKCLLLLIAQFHKCKFLIINTITSIIAWSKKEQHLNQETIIVDRLQKTLNWLECDLKHNFHSIKAKCDLSNSVIQQLIFRHSWWLRISNRMVYVVSCNGCFIVCCKVVFKSDHLLWNIDFIVLQNAV